MIRTFCPRCFTNLENHLVEEATTLHEDSQLKLWQIKSKDK